MAGRFFAHSANFAMPAEQKGCLPEYVISLTVGGQVTYHTASGTLAVTRGDVVIIGPGTDQHWQVTSPDAPWRCYYCIFEPTADQQPLLRYDQQLPGYSRIRLDGRPSMRGVWSAFRRIEALQALTGSRVGQLRSSEMSTLLLWCQASEHDGRPLRDERVTQAMDYMQRHLARSHTIAEVARAVHTSRSRLAELFTCEAGQPMMTWLERVRMQRASQLLELTLHPIAEIAREVGYDDPAYFSNRFRNFAGTSPREYRQRRQR